MMTPENQAPLSSEAVAESTRETWMKPEITSFEPVQATQSLTSSNPGDVLSSNS
jgi:hypothetical protein